ncbi:neuroblast differentiation-associated protein AHNAK [Corythoichthys intestinalis]|uniref:neuroblast differentiation-associated protein AHNAK n=1 Tax=Corythoichthys intestinalis TaxID=161448 RepID=UPI0025A58768|nr:neuroblast differentiation-associated protein AHNAK [Corythoichthys intestinalis]XP_057703501.1 neuroblast differentiation-associated protein AHNAK [Corythoichthys intestinalis]
MSAATMSNLSEGPVLEKSGNGPVSIGGPDVAVEGNSGMRSGDDIVAATIHFDRLSPNEVQKILKALQPYDNNMKVVTKKQLSATASLSSLGYGTQDPSEILSGDFRKADLDVSAQSPLSSLDSPTAMLHAAQGLRTVLNSSASSDLPNVNLTKPLADAEFTAPSVVKCGSDLDGTFIAPDVRLASPHINNHSASLDIDKPQVKSGNLNYKAPHFTMPKFNLPTVQTSETDGDLNLKLPSVNGETEGLKLSSPKLDLNSPNVELNGPNVDLNGPDIDIETPSPDVGVSSDPFKWLHQRGKGPNLKLKKPKLPGAKADLNMDAGLKTPEADVSVPKLEGGLHGPNIDVNMPNADLKSPDLDIQPPQIDGPSGKFVWPHQKWKIPKVKGLKADLDADAGLKNPDLDLSMPKLKSGLNARLDLPKTDLRGPNVDIKTPNLDIDTPSVKKNWHLKLKKPKTPDLKLNTDINTPDIGLRSGSIDAGINAPDVDLNLPKADLDVNAPDVDIEAPSSRVKFPTLKKPKFWLSGPKVKTPSVDLDTHVETPDLNFTTPGASLHGPGLNLPKADVDVKAPDVDASVKTKWHTLKKPKWAISGPKVNGPDLDANVSTPDLSLTAPNLDGELNAPDLKVKTAELNGPKVDIDAEAPSGIFKWFKKPTFGTVRGLKSEVDGDIKVPEVDLKAADIGLTGPDVALSPKIEAPDLDVKGPSLDVQTPEAHIEPIDGKLKLPKLKMPKWPKVKDLDTNVKTPSIDANVDVPNIDLQTPDLDMNADVKGPHLDVASPVLNAPDLSLSGPKIGGSLASPDLSLPGLNATTSAPNISTKLPNAELEALKSPDANVKTPVLGLDSHLGDFKLPHYKLPNLDLSGPGVEVPSTHHSVQAGLETPNVNIGAPDADADIDLSGGKITGGIKGPEFNVESPKVDAGLEKNKLPHFKLPKLNLSGPKMKNPEVNTSPKLSLDGKTSPVTVSIPEISTNTPEIAVRGSPKSKLKWPFRWGFRSNSLDTEELIGNADAPIFRVHTLPKNYMDNKRETPDFFSLSKAEIEARDYVVSKGVRLPVVNVPTRNGERIDIMERLKMAQEKVSPTDEKTISLKMAPPTVDADGDSSLVRGGTYKVEKPESPLGLVAPDISSRDESDKLSLSLSNMLCLNVNNTDADC